MLRARFMKLRSRRLIKDRQKQAKDLSTQAERSFERYVLKRLDRVQPVRRFVIGWMALLLVLFFGLVYQGLNLTHYYQQLKPVAGGTFREGILGTFSTANPLYASSEVDTSVAKLLFASLFTHDEHNKLVGDLASGYDVNTNGTVYTVHLKPHLSWHDGRPLDSADVLYTYKAIQNPDAQSPLRSSWQGITITAPDPKTVVFSLPSPLASFPNTMTNGIVPAHLLARKAATELRTADFNTINPIGAGPFKWRAIQVTGNDPGTAQEQLDFMPFNNYHGGRPQLDHFIVHAYADKNRLTKDFKGGALSALSGLTSRPESITKSADLTAHNFLLSAGTYVFFKNSQPALANQKVRQALVQSADTEVIIKRLDYPTRPVREPLLEGQLAYDSKLAQATFDLSAAKASLDADGWIVGRDGTRTKNKMPLVFNLAATDIPENQQVAKLLQRQWQALGVRINIRLQNVQNFQNTLAYHDYDMVLYGVSIGSDPDVFVYWDSSQADVRSSNRLNLSEYKNATADAALESGRTRLDPTLRTLKYRPFLQAWQQDAPALGLYQPRVLYLTHGAVNGLNDQTVNTPTDRFNNVQNWMIREAKVTNS